MADGKQSITYLFGSPHGLIQAIEMTTTIATTECLSVPVPVLSTLQILSVTAEQSRKVGVLNWFSFYQSNVCT